MSAQRLYRNVCCCLVTQLCPILCDPWTVAHQAPLSMEFSQQEYWSGLPFPSPVDLPIPGIDPGSPALQADALPLSHWGSCYLFRDMIKMQTYKHLYEISTEQTLTFIREIFISSFIFLKIYNFTRTKLDDVQLVFTHINQHVIHFLIQQCQNK